MKDDNTVSKVSAPPLQRPWLMSNQNFGFVCFSTPDEATKSVQEMNGKMIGTKPLYVALAQRKDVRRQALESQMAQRNTQRMQYTTNGMGPQSFMGQPMYGYPPMPGYPQPGMMPMRAPMMGYPGAPGMMQQQRPRYQGMQMQPMPVGYGMPPTQMPYPPAVTPSYPARPRPPTAPAGALPRGQMPVRPPQQGYPEAAEPAPSRLSAQALARAAPGDQKQMLGESLYPLIHEYVSLFTMSTTTDDE